MGKTLLALVGLVSVLSARTAAADESRLASGLFPLSPYYGVCVKGGGILHSSIRSGMYGSPTVTDLSAEGADVTLNIGSFMLDRDSRVSELGKSPGGARIQQVNTAGSSYLLVSNIPGAGGNRVTVQYHGTAPPTLESALRLANRLVGCHLGR